MIPHYDPIRPGAPCPGGGPKTTAANYQKDYNRAKYAAAVKKKRDELIRRIEVAKHGFEQVPGEEQKLVPHEITWHSPQEMAATAKQLIAAIDNSLASIHNNMARLRMMFGVSGPTPVDPQPQPTPQPTPPSQPTQPPGSDLPSWLPERPVSTNQCTAMDGDRGYHCDVQSGHPWTTADGRTDHWMFDMREGRNVWVHWNDWVV